MKTCSQLTNLEYFTNPDIYKIRCSVSFQLACFEAIALEKNPVIKVTESLNYANSSVPINAAMCDLKQRNYLRRTCTSNVLINFGLLINDFILF